MIQVQRRTEEVMQSTLESDQRFANVILNDMGIRRDYAWRSIPEWFSHDIPAEVGADQIWIIDYSEFAGCICHVSYNEAVFIEMIPCLEKPTANIRRTF